eukprot:jgi/Chlat1/8970/Chrsp94S08264
MEQGDGNPAVVATASSVSHEEDKPQATEQQNAHAMLANGSVHAGGFHYYPPEWMHAPMPSGIMLPSLEPAMYPSPWMHPPRVDMPPHMFMPPNLTALRLDDGLVLDPNATPFTPGAMPSPLPPAYHFVPLSPNGPLPPSPMYSFPYQLPPHWDMQMAPPLLPWEGQAPGAMPPSPSANAHSPRVHTSRSLLLLGVPATTSPEDLRKVVDDFGSIRALQTDQLAQGGVAVVHFHDLRHAQEAMKGLRTRLEAEWQQLEVHYTVVLGPLDSAERSDHQAASPSDGGAGGFPSDWHNQGTLVIFNLDAAVGNAELHAAFALHGDVKEVRFTPAKYQHRFVEFYDVRDAAKALQAMDGQQLGGKKLKIEYSRPGGARRSVSGPLGYPPNNMPEGAAYMNHAMSAREQQPHMRPMPYGWPVAYGTFPGPISPMPMPMPMPGPLSPNQGPQHPALSSDGSRGETYVGGPHMNRDFAHSLQGKDTQRRLRREPADTALVKPSSDDSKAPSSCGDKERSRKSGGPQQYEFSAPTASASTVTDSCSASSEDERTTVMIKNIPNKYSQGMLLALLDEHCRTCNAGLQKDEAASAYDFVYLPIDFKNRCNLGYAFVNFTTSQGTLRFYTAFHRQPWEAFNSRKICEITYARLQGREVLEDHFKNSRFACDTDEYLPLIFSPPRDGKSPVVSISAANFASRVGALKGHGHSHGQVHGHGHGHAGFSVVHRRPTHIPPQWSTVTS